MESEQIIGVIAGCLVILLGIALVFVKIEKVGLENSSHTNPGLALFRFGAYRWGVVLVCFIVGVLLLSFGLGWLA